MLLTDRKIAERVANSGMIENYDPENLHGVGYDLRTDHFATKDGTKTKLILQPGESAFAATVENINLPKDVAARVYLRNSRIRMGLQLDAPLYQPGHYTKVFFRLTNVSAEEIHLLQDDEYAMITFEDLGEDVQKPYTGTFSEEIDFKGMGQYENVYNKEKQEIENKKDDIRNAEKSIYSNVLVILTVFVALFSFLTANLSMAANGIQK